jgi:hypothetical protein
VENEAGIHVDELAEKGWVFGNKVQHITPTFDMGCNGMGRFNAIWSGSSMEVWRVNGFDLDVGHCLDESDESVWIVEFGMVRMDLGM